VQWLGFRGSQDSFKQLVQSVPEWISRSGLIAEAGSLSVNLQVSYTSSSFADALNTVEPPANGAVGLVPAYALVDLNAGMDMTEWLRVRAGVNNLFDRQYFTKRPEFYPGPGIWPGDGRALQFTVELRQGALN
jgi:Fe(3+) dicitrate transport protein